MDADDPFECPRCGSPVTERFWGPCTTCREALNAAVPGRAADAEDPEVAIRRFEPAMHVVPNHVATKD